MFRHSDAVDETCPAMPAVVVDDAVVPAAGDAVLAVDDGRRDLKSEALSIAHLMTHKPKNRWCMACQKAKMQHRHRRSKGGMLDADVKKFGDSITADYLIAQNELSRGITGDRDALIIKDRAIGWIACYPVPDKGADEAYAKILNFLGTQKCRYLWTDGSGELSRAAADLGIAHGTSAPETPAANGVAERAVRTVVEGARTALVQAGLPPFLWPMAVRHFCFARNV